MHQNAIIGSHVRTVDQLVVNWHLTEACNYSCRYCYSHWGKSCGKGDLFHDKGSSHELLSELCRFFSPKNLENPLCSHLKWSDLRLSLAGGEPLISPMKTLGIADEARALGFKVSLITNASQLSRIELEPLFGSLSVLGVSLDSVVPNTCHKIGRVDKSGNLISLDDLVAVVEKARLSNPDISLKINTVINRHNCHEDLTEAIARLRPDKWKVLKVLPVVSDELAVTEHEFQSFVERHRHLGSVMMVENNSAMTESYLMIDPLGRFFQNKPDIKAGDSYFYSQPILQCGADAAFRQISFDVEKFAARYPSFAEGVAA
jgi:radical S-adenosyl methionine domain-containing protein 2